MEFYSETYEVVRISPENNPLGVLAGRENYAADRTEPAPQSPDS
jgi:hypothetical protein